MIQAGVVALVVAQLALVPVSDTSEAAASAPAVMRPDHSFMEPAAAEDRWLAVDKVQHFAMSYGAAMFGYGALRGAGASHSDAQAAAIAGSLAVGIGKELYDYSRGRPFSLKDLAWDALGTLAAWGLLSLNR